MVIYHSTCNCSAFFEGPMTYAFPHACELSTYLATQNKITKIVTIITLKELIVFMGLYS